MPKATQPQLEIGLRGRIVEQARELFLDHGYSKVSTSEIAEALGISKKTLYREFDSKEEVLRAVVIPRLKEATLRLEEAINDRSLPFPDKLKAVLAVIGTQQQRVSPVLVRDVCIHAPEVWREIQEHKQARLKKFEKLLEEGVKLGFFRSDIPQEVIIRMHTAAVESLMTPQSLGELPCTAQEVYQGIITVLFEGILERKTKGADKKQNATRTRK
jgi:AcrR family transcriptional regulator